MSQSGDPTFAPRPAPGGGHAGGPVAAGSVTPSKRRARRATERGGSEKRVFFTERRIGIALIVPQLLLIFTFFYWPAGQALFWAFTLEQPWGGGNRWVGFANFAAILGDPTYWNAIVRSTVFAVATSAVAMGAALILAVLADRELRGHRVYRTLLVWPYAIAAPALGLAFRFILAPEAGFLAFFNHLWPGLWNPVLDGFDAMLAVIVAYSWKYIGYKIYFDGFRGLDYSGSARPCLYR